MINSTLLASHLHAGRASKRQSPVWRAARRRWCGAALLEVIRGYSAENVLRIA
jgi:hypothetical protein